MIRIICVLNPILIHPLRRSREGVWQQARHLSTGLADIHFLLPGTGLFVIGEYYLRVRHQLWGLPGAGLENIMEAYSHPQALAQCRFWLQRSFPHVEITETSSTTRAAKLCIGNPKCAALAGALAAETYDLDILEDNVQDSQANFTRFLVLGRQCPPRTGKDRSSLMINVPDKVGALFEALEPFTRYKINMTRIESRPNKRKAWEYYFFLDIQGHTDDPEVQQALDDLRNRGAYVKILGSYPDSEWV